MKISLPYFDTIDTTELDECYEAEIDFHGQELSLDLNFEEELSYENWADEYQSYIKHLDKYHEQIKQMIKEYYGEEGLVREFFEHHFECVDDEMQALFDETDEDLPEEDRWLSLLKLTRIGFYFAEDNFATWDFSFGSDFSDQIYVVITDKNGDVLDTTWES